MSAPILKVPASMECDGCGETVNGTWDVPAAAFGRMRCPDASAASRLLARRASEEGWLVHGTAALCPTCLQAAVTDGAAHLPPPTSAVQAIDQIALAREVRKLRREAGFDEHPDR